MPIKENQAKESLVEKYQVQYSISEYTFPSECYIHQVSFDDAYMNVDLTDGRKVSIPLWWIPTLYNALPEAREKYAINRGRTMLIWDPKASGINEEVRIADYLNPGKKMSES